MITTWIETMMKLILLPTSTPTILISDVTTMKPMSHTHEGTAGTAALKYDAPMSHIAIGKNTYPSSTIHPATTPSLALIAFLVYVYVDPAAGKALAMWP